MLLTIDIGNSNITLGVYDGDKLKAVSRMSTDHRRTSDQYAVELRDIMDINGCAMDSIDGAIISSVVPDVSSSLLSAVEKLCGVKPLMVGPGVKSGLNIKIDNPAQLGGDLVAGAIAALNAYPLPCIIIDLGTASTLSVINEKGEFLGGVIATGIGISLEALTNRTAQLPHINIEAPKKVIGSNTVDSMKSGLVLGTASMIDGMVARIEAEISMPATVIATGGLAREVIRYCMSDIILDENLILEGLRLIYNKNI